MRKLKNYNPSSAKAALSEYLVGEESGGEHRAFCPRCEDPNTSSTPSASMNFDKDVWNCQSSTEHPCGSISTLIPWLKQNKGFDYKSKAAAGRMLVENNPLAHVNAERSSNSKERTIEELETDVRSWELRLHSAPQQLRAFGEKRGLTVETIKRFHIGWDGQRYTIPVYDAEGHLVNVRRYLMGASATQQKMLNAPGHGSVTLFNVAALKHDEVVLCEGELDCMLLEQMGIPALTATAGAATFKPVMAGAFVGKDVYICYDVDETGRNGATKAAGMIAKVARSVHKVTIPLPDKGADVTDYLFLNGHTAEDFRSLMDSSEYVNVMSHAVAEEPPEDGKKVSLEDSMSEELRDETLEVRATVTGKQNPPFSVPRKFNIACAMDNGKACEFCPVALHNGDMDYEIPRDDPQLFDFVNTNREKYPKLMQTISDAKCTNKSKYNVQDTYHVEELIVSNSVDDRKIFETDKPVSRSVYSVSTHDTSDNSVVRLVGRNVASMKDARMMFMAWINEPVRTSLDEFELEDSTRKALSAFQVKTNDPDNHQSPLDKCFEIAQDIAKYQTHIYGRDLLHVAYDLVWHSPLAFEVEGKMIEKGWLEMMVVGDTRTGKSETAVRLAEHYRSGVVKSCESMSFAGLVGGNQQVGSGSWITTWGVVPLNDRRLVVLDEVSGLKEKDVIENMSSIRSSGVAQITKINTQSTSARTRLIWITNPSDGAMIDERPGLGVDALRSVVKNQEDIARFDFVMAARASEVDPSEINRKHSERGTAKYDSETCSALVLWAWSLKPEQIDFSASAVEEARKIAQEVRNEYVSDPPLIQAENFRFKLYRIAAALAARTFYIQWPEKDKIQLRVNKDHVQDAKRFLDMVYGAKGGMGYRSASRRLIQDRQKAVMHRETALDYLLEHPDTVLATLKSVMRDTQFRGRDFEEFGGMQRNDALNAVKVLSKMGMLHRLNQGYIRMDKVLASILRELEGEEEEE